MTALVIYYHIQVAGRKIEEGGRAFYWPAVIPGVEPGILEGERGKRRVFISAPDQARRSPSRSTQ
jgi:hypothetical protein